MFGLRKKWSRLRSGLYVPPLLRRVHRDERGLWYPCCSDGGPVACAGCTGNAPAEFDVTFSGLVNRVCNSCPSYDGTYRVTYQSGSPTACFYQYAVPAGSCDIDYVDFLLSKFLSPTRGRMDVYIGTGGYYALFRYDPGTLIDCMNLSSQVAAHAATHASAACDGSSATCSISSV